MGGQASGLLLGNDGRSHWVSAEAAPLEGFGGGLDNGGEVALPIVPPTPGRSGMSGGRLSPVGQENRPVPRSESQASLD